MGAFTVLAWARFEGEIDDIRPALERAVVRARGDGLVAEDEAGARVSLRFRLEADTENRAFEAAQGVLRTVFPDFEHGVVSVTAGG